MGRYWWAVWIKVAILAIALLVTFNFVKGVVQSLFEPYLLEESLIEDADSEDADLITKLVAKVEDTFNINIDYENMIFDYANGYALDMMEQSVEERNAIDGPLDE